MQKGCEGCSRSLTPHSATSPVSPGDEEDDYMGSSTSTAGPPPESNTMTGRFPRPQWSLATGKQRGGSEHSISSSASTHTRRAPHPDSYRPGPDDSSSYSAHLRESHSRTMSNTSVSVSPMGSSNPKEWCRSFRLFNSSRFLASASNSRQRDGSAGQVYRNTFVHLRNGRSSSNALDSERALSMSHAANQQHGSFFGTFNGQGGRSSFWPSEAHVTGVLAMASQYAATNPSASTSMASPLCGFSRVLGAGASSRGFFDGHAVHRVMASCATGAVVCTVLPSQNELPLVMNALRTHIALRGKTIIRGDAKQPMDIRKGPLIGSGGFAKVYAGVNTMRGELVAIKEIDISGVDDVKALNAIEEEFALLRSLHHPNIVRYSLFEHSKSQQVCRITMELLAGDSTLHLLQKYGPLTEAVLRIMTRSILRAIQFIHKEGIFHRDIKPANILVSHRGEVKLCDFGCSKRVSELNKAASCIIGTPVYMAPEFIKGEAGHKADIWSMACSLFELSTGMQPWYHSGVKDNIPLMFYITTTSDSPLVFTTAEARGDFSEEFFHFMDLCFTRNVANRPEAEELLKHPWITGLRLVPTPAPLPSAFLALHQENGATCKFLNSPGKSSTFSSPRDSAVDRDDTSFNGSDGMQKSVSISPTLNPLEEELACQQELESVAAATALDLCTLLICPLEIPRRGSQEPVPVETISVADETSPLLTRTFSIPSPALGHRGGPNTNATDLPSPMYTPEHSVVHDNFYYSQVPLGSSAGNFVLPLGLDLDGTVPQQQYLRINEEGNLDMVHLPDDEMEESMPSRCVAVGDSIYGSFQSGRPISPARNSSFSRGVLSPRIAAAANVVGVTESLFSPLLSVGGGFSRGESPSRGAPSFPPTPQGIPVPPLLSRTGPPVTFASQTSSNSGSPHAPHVSPHLLPKASGTREAGSPLTPRSSSVASTQKSESFRGLPEKLKTHADGKLHMSFCVNTAPGCAVNVELNVDVADVQCKVVDNQPNFVVAFTDDVRSQIASKIKEVAAQSSPGPTAPSPVRAHSPVSISGGPEGRGSVSGGSHFYHGLPFSAGPRLAPKPPTRVSTGNVQRLLAVQRDRFGGSPSHSGEEGSEAGSLTSPPVATILSNRFK